MKAWTSLWEQAVEVWTIGVFGANLGSYISALLIMLVFLTLRHLFTVIVLRFLQSLASRTETELDDAVLSTARGPLRFLFILIGAFFAIEALPLSPEAEAVGAKIISTLMYITFFWVLYNAMAPLIEGATRVNGILTGAVFDWAVKGLRFVVILLGVAAVLELWGIPVAPIIGGLGLFGVAVALGAQDLFKNLIAGVLILAEERFQKGNWIKVDGVVEGIVDSIGFRSTTVRQFDKALVQVPNAKLSDNPLTNYSRMTFRRIYWHIGVTYDTSIPQLELIRQSIEDYITTSDDFARPSETATFVRIDRFGASSIDIMIYCFTRTIVWGEYLAAKERLAKRIKEIVEDEAGSGFAFPSQSLYVEALPDPDAKAEARARGERAWQARHDEAQPEETPERFTPPGSAKPGLKPVTASWRDAGRPEPYGPRLPAVRPEDESPKTGQPGFVQRLMSYLSGR